MPAAIAGCSYRAQPAVTPPAKAPHVTFRDVTAQVGIRFRHVNGAAGKKFLPETMGAGCAFLDYDNDGWLDVLLINGTYWPGNPRPNRPTLKLYRNENGRRFADVTQDAGLDVEMYGMGAAVGDYDNDGWDDLYLTGVGQSRLFHNEAGSKGRVFHDVTARAGVSSPGWATSATWVDYDRDGLLDLFVCHYVQWTPETDRFFSLDGIHRSYSTPEQYPGETCRLYRNEGGGKFVDVTRSAGIYSTRSKALGVVICDFDQDGWPDLVIANDTVPNFLFHNQGDGSFKEVALATGIAMSESGKAKAGMGVDVGDERNNGWDSIVITNFSGEQLTLYRRDATGHYLDEAARSGIGSASQLYLGFGTFFFDYDSDRWLDIFVANGHIQDDAWIRQTGVAYEEPALLLRNTGAGTYRDVTSESGAALTQKVVGRGAAWGDFDNDGDPDILMTANNGPARLLRNDNRTGNNWLRLILEGTHSNRNAIGARVRVRVGEQQMTQTVKGASSYLSQSDRRLLFGLGKEKRVDAIEIQWPSGQVKTLGPVEGNRTVVVKEEGV